MRNPLRRSLDALHETRARTAALVAVAALVAAPAGILQALCVGKACRSAEPVSARVPFCTLAPELRSLIAAGYREGRSPNLLAVARPPGVVSRAGPRSLVAWPEIGGGAATAPVAFHGTGVSAGASVPTGTTLDQIAPTIAEIIGLRRAHPEVRSGTAIPGIASGKQPRLVLEVVLKGAGASTLEEGGWPQLQKLMGAGAATTAARVPSLPLDPAATIATIGTGGLPRQHGITGTHVRSDSGRLVAAWSRRAPPSIIATLADDLDEGSDQEPHIGLIADSPSDRGLVGDDWYVDNDEDDLIVAQDLAGAARTLLKKGYGRDEVPDLLGVTIAAEAGHKDAELGTLIGAARAASRNSLLTVVAGTGRAKPDPEAVGSGTLVDALERETGTGLVEGVAVGGVFIDQTELAAQQLTEEQIGGALRSLEDDLGSDPLADAFTGIAVSFARYC